MRVRIVCYENVNEWILGKFALKMKENLSYLGIESDISNEPDRTADINHHINYGPYRGGSGSKDTLMITHIDNYDKLVSIRKNLHEASLGICMSKETMLWLAEMGADKDKLCYVNPAHDQLAKIKKIVLGISSRVYADGRKNESYFSSLAKELDSKYFSFKIMGGGWDKQVRDLRKNGFEVTYFNSFIKEEYYPMITSLDYYIYMGTDEGQLGFVDALAAGVKTIVTPQGYHLDPENAITHPFTNYNELLEILLKIQKEKSHLTDSISSWNWLDYTKKHVELWKNLLGETFIESGYYDGLSSLRMMRELCVAPNNTDIQKKEKALKKTKIKHFIRNNINYNGIRFVITRFFSTNK